MDTPAVPTLSTAGFLSAPETMMTYLFDCFLASEESQSNLFDIKSFTAVIAKYSGSPEEVTQQVQQALNELYTPYFERVSCVVNGEPWHEDPSKWFLRIRLTVFRDGISYDLQRAVIKDSNGRLKATSM